MSEGKGDHKSLRVLLDNYMSNTSAHGLPNINRASNPKRKAFWSILFLWAFGMFLWQSLELIVVYFSWPVDVNIDIQYRTQINFPAVTICNLNPIKTSSIKDSDAINHLIGSIEALGYQDFTRLDYMVRDNKLDLFDRVTDVLSQTNYEQRVHFGHQIEDLLLVCSYQGYPCGPLNFTYFYNYLYGNCYTFNSGIGVDVLNASKSGPLLGLDLELNIEETEYMPSIQQAAGIRVLINEQFIMTFPEDAGINVAPGLLTSVGMRKLEIERKGDPYSLCQEDTVARETIFSTFFNNVSYSLEACQKDCLYRMIQKRCYCDDARFRFLKEMDPCLSTNTTQVSCKEEVERDYANEEFTCTGCTSPCLESSFELTVSSAAWPNTLYAKQVLQDLRNISENVRDNVDKDPGFVSKNVLKLQVYYEQLNFETITTTEKYDSFALISNLGGQVGLWIGISMCTVFEVVELLYDILKLLAFTLFGTRAKRATSPSLSDLELVHNKIHVDYR